MQDFSDDSRKDPDEEATTQTASNHDADPYAHMGLRERKRRLTRLRIEGEATRLFLEHSYDSVTLEDICSAADISRRTFFNYFDSKDHVALGVAPPPLTDEDINALANLPPNNATENKRAEHSGSLETRLFRLLLSRRAEQFRDCDGTVLDAELAEDIARRRAMILERTPELALAKLTRFHDLRQKLGEAITTFLENNPEQRRFAEEFTAAEEAFLVVATAISALWASSALNAQRTTPAIDSTRAQAIARALGTLHHHIGEDDTPRQDL